jgi:hypothetical protein
MSHVQSACFQPLSAQLQGPGHGDRAVQRALRDSVADALDLEAKGRGVHGLAVAIREKFAASNAGPDAVSSVLETIDRALDDAAGKLAAQGFSQEQIDAGIDRFRQKLAREIGELAGSGQTTDATKLDKSAIAAREVVRERFSLNVLTAEGDKVSIRFKTLSVTEAAAAQVSDGTTTATAVSGSVISRGRFQVAVEGNLNEAERAAIGDLLDKVDDIAADFFSGDVQAAFSAAARVGIDSSALSAFDLKLSYSRSVAAVKTYTSTAQLGGAPAQPVTTPAPTPTPVLQQPSLVTTDPVRAPVADSAAAATPAEAPVATLPVSNAANAPPAANAADTAPAAEGTAISVASAQNTAKLSSALQTITSFAEDVLERLDDAGDSKSTKFSLRWKVEFLVKAFGSVALTPTEQKAADALGIALDAQHPGA